MTQSEKNHARRVSVTRVDKTAGGHTRRAVAVRLRAVGGEEQNIPAETAAKAVPAEDDLPVMSAAEEAPPAPADDNNIVPWDSALPDNAVSDVTAAEDAPASEEPSGVPAQEPLAAGDAFRGDADASPSDSPCAAEETVTAGEADEAEAEEIFLPAEVIVNNPSADTPEDNPVTEEVVDNPLPAEASEPEPRPEEESPPVSRPEPMAETAEPSDGISAGLLTAEREIIPVSVPDTAGESQRETAAGLPTEQPTGQTSCDNKAPRRWWELPEDFTLPQWLYPQKWKDITILRKLIMGASVVLALFSILPLFVGVLSPGILPPLMIAAFFFLCALYWPLIDGCESTWGNVIIAVVAVCVMAGVVYLSFVSGKMISASANILREDRADVTVVVLGCKVNGDKPSRMLQARLEAAADFLLEHPQAHCIVSGGKGPDEQYHEAFIMKKYLVDKGISSMRIIMEDKSTSTLENINFSAVLAEKYNCHERFLIVTDRFHQYRAMSAANRLGIVTYALNVETVWYLAMPYWFREMAAITRDWLIA